MTALDDAIGYARRGWPVVALHAARDGACSCGRTECRSAGKHPRLPRGHDDATLDVETIRRWWARWPDANVGIRTGAESTTVVLDVDPRNGGDDALIELERRFGALPPTVLALTGGGGRHFYFAHPQTRRVACARNFGGFNGLDLKADDGFVVAPPSRHASGREYVWEVSVHPDDIALAPLPQELLALAAQDRTSARVAYDCEHWDGTLPDRAREAILVSPRIQRRFQRDAGGLRDTSASGVDASLATLLALEKVADAEIEHALRVSRAAAGLPARPPSYYEATIGRALATAGEIAAAMQVDRDALRWLPALCARWLPAGVRVGREFCADALVVDLVRGEWGDFASGDRGRGATSLATHVLGIDRAQAAQRLAAMLGGEREGAR